MNYLISEEELIKLVQDNHYLAIDGEYITIRLKADFLKFKQPVELLAEGEVDYSGIVDKYYVGGNNIPLQEKLYDSLGKQIKLYIEVGK